MNALLIGASLATLLSAMPASSQVDFATMDIGALTQDDNRVTKLLNCFFDDSACGEEELTVKAGLREAFDSRCEGCTQERKTQIKNFFSYIKTNRPDDWARIKAKCDPTGERQEIWKQILA